MKEGESVCVLFPVARRSSVDVPKNVRAGDIKFVTSASAMEKECKVEKDRFKGLMFAG